MSDQEPIPDPVPGTAPPRAAEPSSGPVPGPLDPDGSAAPTAPPAPRRRGCFWQQPRRRLEEPVRQQGVAFRQGVAEQGLTRLESAAWLGISARSLRDWEQRLRMATGVVPARGRPVLRCELAARQETNTLGRPWGAYGPTPAERGADRRVVTPAEREAFAASVACQEEEAACTSPAAPAVVELAPPPEPVSQVAAAPAASVDHPASAAGRAHSSLPGQTRRLAYVATGTLNAL